MWLFSLIVGKRSALKLNLANEEFILKESPLVNHKFHDMVNMLCLSETNDLDWEQWW